VTDNSTLSKLTAFYRIHNPEKLSAGIEQVVAAYAGREDFLNTALMQQYGQDLTSLAAAAPPKPKRRWFHR
jgi:hypothetical protein